MISGVVSRLTRRKQKGDAYLKEGSAESEMLVERQALRNNDSVMPALARFHATLDAREGGGVDRGEALRVQLMIAKALFAPDEYDENACRAAAEADWERDTGNCLARDTSKEVFLDGA